MHNIVKNTTIINPLDLLAPHSCRGCGYIGNIVCKRCKNYIISHHTNLCPLCKSPTLNGICEKCQILPPTFIINERSTLIGNLVHDFKYHSIHALAKPLAEILNQILPPIDGQVIIIPLPTITRHIRERGFDHTYLIAKHLAKLRGQNYSVKQLLVRRKNTIQVGTNRNTRTLQAKQAYRLAKNTHLDPNITYLLLDDVWTTGASMRSAYTLLQNAGTENTIIAILALSRI